MRTMQALYARYRYQVGAVAPVRAELPPDNARAAVRAALTELETIASRPAFGQRGALTQDDVFAYAMALMHLREAASAAGCARLTKACDALAVTVARLIENCTAARCDQCTALRQFVAHARAMIEMEMADMAVPDACLLGDNINFEHAVRASR